MIDLRISGFINKDVIAFQLNNETKCIDQFSKEIHFYLEEKKNYRIYFEQKTEQHIPHWCEIVLEIILLPIRGIFNVIAFNADNNWENDISAFKLSGYIEVSLTENTEVFFNFKQGRFDKIQKKFIKPSISFSPNAVLEQNASIDSTDINQKYNYHLLNIISVSLLLFALMVYLLFVGLTRKLYIACIIILVLSVAFAILILWLVHNSFKKKKFLLEILESMQIK